jgi:hypothetical protein
MDTNLIFLKRFGPPVVIGAIVGGIAGYFLGELIVKQLEKAAQKSEEEDDWQKESWLEEDEKTVEEIAKIDYTKYTKPKGNLEELVKPYTSSIDEKLTKKGKSKVQDKANNIMIISLEEYEGNRAMNKEPISYYVDDATFADINEDIIPNPNDLFPVNIHLHFGQQSEDPDIVYVRNENNGCDYEITQIHGSYSVIVAGFPAEAPKDTKAKRRRTTKKVSANDEEENEDE